MPPSCTQWVTLLTAIAGDPARLFLHRAKPDADSPKVHALCTLQQATLAKVNSFWSRLKASHNRGQVGQSINHAGHAQNLLHAFIVEITKPHATQVGLAMSMLTSARADALHAQPVVHGSQAP